MLAASEVRSPWTSSIRRTTDLINRQTSTVENRLQVMIFRMLVTQEYFIIQSKSILSYMPAPMRSPPDEMLFSTAHPHEELESFLQK